MIKNQGAAKKVLIKFSLSRLLFDFHSKDKNWKCDWWATKYNFYNFGKNIATSIGLKLAQ